jgi:hypothetical protein
LGKFASLAADRDGMDADLNVRHRRAVAKMAAALFQGWEPSRYGIDDAAVEVTPPLEGGSLGGLRYPMSLRGQLYSIEVRHAGGRRFTLHCSDRTGGQHFTRVTREATWEKLSAEMHWLARYLDSSTPKWRG